MGSAQKRGGGGLWRIFSEVLLNPKIDLADFGGFLTWFWLENVVSTWQHCNQELYCSQILRPKRKAAVNVDG